MKYLFDHVNKLEKSEKSKSRCRKKVTDFKNIPHANSFVFFVRLYSDTLNRKKKFPNINTQFIYGDIFQQLLRITLEEASFPGKF